MKFPKIYKDKDVSLDVIRGIKVGIIGFGNQGRAQALNLRDSGIAVTIGLREGSPSAGSGTCNKQLAYPDHKETGGEVETEGLKCQAIPDVVNNCDIISMLIPDQVMGVVYSENIAPNLTEGQSLLFSHGYNIHYKLIKPPGNVNVIMAAPSGSGTELRKRYLDDNGIPGLFAIHQDYSGNAEELVLAYCKAIGLTKSGVLKSTFREETETDLFGEQMVLTGGIPKLIQSSYKVLLEGGYSPAIAWMVCYYELKTIVDMFHSKGFEFMNNSISDTAEYGGITRGKRIINAEVEAEMKKALKEIQSGEFYREWKNEHENGYPQLEKLRKEEKELPIEAIGQHMLKALFGGK